MHALNREIISSLWRVHASSETLSSTPHGNVDGDSQSPTIIVVVQIVVPVVVVVQIVVPVVVVVQIVVPVAAVVVDVDRIAAVSLIMVLIKKFIPSPPSVKPVQPYIRAILLGYLSIAPVQDHNDRSHTVVLNY